MRILLLGLLVACRGEDKPAPPPPPRPAPPPAADAGIDAHVIPAKTPVTLACPAGTTQRDGSRSTSGADRVATSECRTSKGERRGPYVVFDELGDLREEGSYDDRGELDGPFHGYRGGRKEEDGQYDHGKMTGTWKRFYASGKVDCVDERDKDLTVALTCYNDAGKLIVRGKSPGGTNEGLWEWFHHDDGSPSVATLYKNGEEVKNWVWKHGKRVEATSEEARSMSDYAHPKKPPK